MNKSLFFSILILVWITACEHRFNQTSTDDKTNSTDTVSELITHDTISIIRTESIQTIDNIILQTIIEQDTFTTNRVKSNKITPKQKGDYFYFISDSSLYSFEPNQKTTKLIYQGGSGVEIKEFDFNERDGYYILLWSRNFSKLINIRDIGSPNEFETLYFHDRYEGEGYEVVSGFELSPTGDFLALSMGFWEGKGLRILDLRDNSVLNYFPEFGYLTDFVKWLPYNSALLISGEGSEMNGFGLLRIFNMNLETMEYKVWEIEKTIYEGYFEKYGSVTIIGTPSDDNPRVLRLERDELREIKDHKIYKSFSGTNSRTDSVHVNIVPKKLSFDLTFRSNGKLEFNKTYELAYPGFNGFTFKGLKYDSITDIIRIDFLTHLNAKIYGYVIYHLDSLGFIIKKSYLNEHTNRQGFEEYGRKWLIDSTSITTVSQRNGVIQGVYKTNNTLGIIPKEITFQTESSRPKIP